jgi:hypothetical protein
VGEAQAPGQRWGNSAGHVAIAGHNVVVYSAAGYVALSGSAIPGGVKLVNRGGAYIEVDAQQTRVGGGPLLLVDGRLRMFDGLGYCHELHVQPNGLLYTVRC